MINSTWETPIDYLMALLHEEVASKMDGNVLTIVDLQSEAVSIADFLEQSFDAYNQSACVDFDGFAPAEIAENDAILSENEMYTIYLNLQGTKTRRKYILALRDAIRNYNEFELNDESRKAIDIIDYPKTRVQDNLNTFEMVITIYDA